MTAHTRPLLVVVALLVAGTVLSARPAPAQDGRTPSWRDDPAWYAGTAEWALYDAVRPIYGVPRKYEATIFTNKQQMDPATTTKASDWRDPAAVEVFKHNLSEMVPTENYTYRFLTTAFVRTDTLDAFKVAASTQEDCGATYRQFVVAGERVQAEQSCYFPGAGTSRAEYAAPAGLAFHDALSLTLRDYPFDAPFDATDKPVLELDLVPDQTDTHETGLRPRPARVEYVERTTLDLPYGTIDAHHLRVTHERDGGTTASNYWFAADPALRHVMVRYAGPYGVGYELKKLDWWAYWDRGAPRPE